MIRIHFRGGIRSAGVVGVAVAILLAILAVAGCSAPDPLATSSGAPPASVAATGSPVPEPSVDDHGAPDLEAVLPREAGSIALSTVSLTGADFMALGTASNQAALTELLDGLSATVGDLAIAQAHDPEGRLVLQVGAFRVRGADPAALLPLWVASQQAARRNALVVSEADIAGRHVTRLVDPAREVGATTLAYAKGDTIFLVLADDAELVAEMLGKLP